MAQSSSSQRNYNQFENSALPQNKKERKTGHSTQMNVQQQKLVPLQQQQHHEKILSNLILQDVCTSLTQNFQMQSINSFQHLSSQYIDQVVEIEMKRLKANYSREEENYVEQMLLENPIIVERRKTPSAPPTNNGETAPALSSPAAASRLPAPDYCYISALDVLGCDDEEGRPQQKQQQQQQQQPQPRSNSCRRSRINNKIKKAKTKYRHKFMSNKLLQSANVLECLQKLIEQTENQLINQGLNALQLLKLKTVFYNDFMARE